MNSYPPFDWQSECGRYAVRIKRRAFKAMLHLAESHAPYEVGTSLVGAYSDDGHEATVLSLAPLSPDSQGSRFTFFRGIAGLADFFRRVFKRFNGKRHYIGEWHSHPNASPIPSSADDNDQLRIASDIDTDCSEVILVIVGGNYSEKSELGVFVYSRSKGRIVLRPKD